MTWILYFPGKYSSHAFFKFEKAEMDLGVCPATYKRSVTGSTFNLARCLRGLVGIFEIIYARLFRRSAVDAKFREGRTLLAGSGMANLVLRPCQPEIVFEDLYLVLQR